jgi:uncharacterized protein YqgV (UPF0045/DUF77 family)
MFGRPSQGFTFGGPAPAKDDYIILEPRSTTLRKSRLTKTEKYEEIREPESQESLTFSFGATRLNSGSKPAARTDAKMSERHEIGITGLLVKDPKSNHIVSVQKTVFVYNAGDDEQKAMVEDAVETLKEESSLLKTHFFGTTIEVPKDFLPTAVGGITENFRITTIAKMVREVKVAKRARAASKKRRVSPADK